MPQLTALSVNGIAGCRSASSNNKEVINLNERVKISVQYHNLVRWTLSNIAVIMNIIKCWVLVATNLENLEYSGISLNMENSGNSQGILCNLSEKLREKL